MAWVGDFLVDPRRMRSSALFLLLLAAGFAGCIQEEAGPQIYGIWIAGPVSPTAVGIELRQADGLIQPAFDGPGLAYEYVELLAPDWPLFLFFPSRASDGASLVDGEWKPLVTTSGESAWSYEVRGREWDAARSNEHGKEHVVHRSGELSWSIRYADDPWRFDTLQLRRNGEAVFLAKTFEAEAIGATSPFVPSLVAAASIGEPGVVISEDVPAGEALIYFDIWCRDAGFFADMGAENLVYSRGTKYERMIGCPESLGGRFLWSDRHHETVNYEVRLELEGWDLDLMTGTVVLFHMERALNGPTP